MCRDRGFLGLMRPDQLHFEPGVTMDSVDLQSTPIEGLDGVVDGLIAGIPAVWDDLAARWSAAGGEAELEKSPLGGFRALIGCIGELLERHPTGDRAAALVPLMAQLDRLVRPAPGGGPGEAVTPFEVLAAELSPRGRAARRDAAAVGAERLGLAGPGRGGWDLRFEAAVWEGAGATGTVASPPTLDQERARIDSLSSGARRALNREAIAHTPEDLRQARASLRRQSRERTQAVRSEISPGTGIGHLQTPNAPPPGDDPPSETHVLTRHASRGAGDSAAEAPTVGLDLQEEVIARIEAERLSDEIRRLGLTALDIDLLMAGVNEETIAQVARRHGIREATGRKRLERIRARLAHLKAED